MRSIYGVKYLEPQEVCNQLGISPSTLKRWRTEGKIQYIKLSERMFLYPESGLTKLINEAVNEGNQNKTLLDGKRKDDRKLM